MKMLLQQKGLVELVQQENDYRLTKQNCADISFCDSDCRDYLCSRNKHGVLFTHVAKEQPYRYFSFCQFPCSRYADISPALTDLTEGDYVYVNPIGTEEYYAGIVDNVSSAKVTVTFNWGKTTKISNRTGRNNEYNLCLTRENDR